MESLCGNTGACSSNVKVVNCQNCWVVIDWAMERALFIEPVPGFWVVNGDPPRTPNPDSRDGDELFYVNSDPVRVPIRRSGTYFDEDTGTEKPWHSVDYQMRYAAEIPRPYIGRDATVHQCGAGNVGRTAYCGAEEMNFAPGEVVTCPECLRLMDKEWCRMMCSRGSENGQCPCKRPLDCRHARTSTVEQAIRVLRNPESFER